MLGRLAFLMAMATLASQAFAAGTCGPILERSTYLALALKAVEVNLLSSADLLAAATSEVPVNPLAGQAITPENVAFFSAFNLTLSSPPVIKYWPGIRARLRQVAEKNDEQEADRSEAVAKTHEFISPKLVKQFSVLEGNGVYPTLVTRAGHVIYAVETQAGYVEVHNLTTGQRIWQAGEPIAWTDIQTRPAMGLSENSDGSISFHSAANEKCTRTERWANFCLRKIVITSMNLFTISPSTRTIYRDGNVLEYIVPKSGSHILRTDESKLIALTDKPVIYSGGHGSRIQSHDGNSFTVANSPHDSRDRFQARNMRIVTFNGKTWTESQAETFSGPYTVINDFSDGSLALASYGLAGKEFSFYIADDIAKFKLRSYPLAMTGDTVRSTNSFKSRSGRYFTAVLSSSVKDGGGSTLEVFEPLAGPQPILISRFSSSGPQPTSQLFEDHAGNVYLSKDGDNSVIYQPFVHQDAELVHFGKVIDGEKKQFKWLTSPDGQVYVFVTAEKYRLLQIFSVLGSVK